MKKLRKNVIDEDEFIDMDHKVDIRGILVLNRIGRVFDWQDIPALTYQWKHEDIGHYPHSGHIWSSSGGSSLPLLPGLEFQCWTEWKYDSVNGVWGFDNSPACRSCRY